MALKKINQNSYMLTCVPGAEKICADEVREWINTSEIHTERGKVFFQTQTSAERFFSLRCADNVYRILNRFTLGTHKADLHAFAEAIARLDYSPLLMPSGGEKPAIIVSASRIGKQTYSRFDLSDAAEHALIATGKFKSGDKKNHAFAFRIDVKDTVCLYSVQLTPAEFKFRGVAFSSSKGGLRPSAAHCLIRLSQPKGGDVFYDPFCGAGTIPFERAAYPYKKIFASDINPSVLEIARSNLPHDVITFLSDATATKIKSASITTVVTNMPWGKQIEVDNLPLLYTRFLSELIRILKPDGKAVVLTDQIDLLYSVCSDVSLQVRCLSEWSLHGLHPSVFMLTPLVT